MKIDPFDPELLRDYDVFCRVNGHSPFREYAVRWHAVTALMEAAVTEGRDPFSVTIEDVRLLLTAEGFVELGVKVPGHS